ncbi:MAG: purine-nucleoside phosphorylase [Acidobacteriota bacterium]
MSDQALLAAAARWRSEQLPSVDVGVCTGSGLTLDLGRIVYGPAPLSDWLPFQVDALPGHAHELVVCEIADPSGGGATTRVLHLRGRVHAYQGYTPQEIVFAVRWVGLLGARVMVHANAAGSLETSMPVGSLVLIEDHLNLTGLNPLTGRSHVGGGETALDATPFVDLSDLYSARLIELATAAGEEVGVTLPRAVYAGLLGPSFETPAEIRMLRGLGAGLVGMSTVLETIACKHLGLSNLGVSLVTNLAAGMTAEIGHEEIYEVGERARPRLGRWLERLLTRPDLLATKGAL